MKHTCVLTALLLIPSAAINAAPSADAKGGQPSEITPATGMPAKPWQIGAPIVTYWAGPMPMTEAAAKQMADGNWNLAWVTKQGLPAGGALVAHYRTQLDILHRRGLRGVVSLGLWNMDDPEKKSQLDAIVDSLRTPPSLYAYSLKDEPNSSLFPELARMRACLKEKDPSHLVYVNLYPCTASNKQLGITGDQVPAYREYVRQFTKSVRPELLSYDHYHFGVKGDGLKTEFAAIAKELQPLRSLAVRHAGMIPEGATPLADDTSFRLDPPVPTKDFPPRPAKLTDAEEAALSAEGGSHHSRVEGFVIGCFGKDNSPTHALVVNLDYRTYSGLAQPRRDEFLKPVVRAVVGPGRLEVFDATTSKWSPAGTSRVELHLPPGGGKLVRVQ